MKIVFSVEPSKRTEVENIVKGDDLISRQSIIIRTAASLGLEAKFGNSYIIILEGSEEALKKAEELLKENAKLVENTEEITKKVKEDDEKAIEGFGSIFG